LVVVANPDDAADIAAMLGRAGVAVAWSGAGGEETIARLQADPPDVVVLCASLTHGDARALTTALRASAGASIGIVLVGDAAGPVRNALDARDYDVDRFIGRPLAPKALAFAVRSSVPERAPRAITETIVVPPVAQASMLAFGQTRAPTSDPAGASPGAAPRGGNGAGAAAAPGMSAAPGVAASDGGARVTAAAGAAAAPSTAVVDDWTEPVARGDLESRLEAATDSAIDEFLRDALTALPMSAAGGPADGGEPGSVPTWREQTLILSGGGTAPHAAPPPPRDRGGARSAGRGGDGGGARAAGDAHAHAHAHDPAPAHASIAAGDIAHDRPAAEPERSAAPTAGAGVGDFGRELRAKMSQMAARLFPGVGAAVESIDIPAARSPHADIDLNALGAPPGVAAPYADIASADTFSETDPGFGQARAQAEPTPTVAGRPDLRGEFDLDGGRPTQDPTDTFPGTTRRRTAAAPTSRGEIDPVDDDVATIIARLFRDSFTGRLIMRRGDAEKVLHFEEGRPVFATSNLPHDRMGDLLYREGKITREQHARSRELVAESGRRMGEILVDHGFLKRRELLPAVRRHIEDIIYSLFGWESGEWVAIPGEGAAAEKIRLSRHPATLVIEGVRRKYGIDLLERRVGPAGTAIALRASDGGGLLKELDLGAAERRVVEQLDGARGLEAVAAAAGVDLLTAYQIAFALLVLGVGAVARPDPGDTDVWGEAARQPSLVGATDLAIDRQRVIAKHAHVGEADYFMLLGVRRDASAFEIKRAYESARRDYAIDAFPDELRDDLGAQLEEINALLEEAYQVLRDERLRDAYRANLRD
jgi:CheY-like chemotaxis protein